MKQIKVATRKSKIKNQNVEKEKEKRAFAAWKYTTKQLKVTNIIELKRKMHE